jgi:hypothetical protein
MATQDSDLYSGVVTFPYLGNKRSALGTYKRSNFLLSYLQRQSNTLSSRPNVVHACIEIDREQFSP